jgi:hypothetical protein
MEPEGESRDEAEEQVGEAEPALTDEEIVTEETESESRRHEEDDDVGEGMDWPE